MKKVLVTGSRGFIGKNLVEALSRRPDTEVTRFDSRDNVSNLDRLLADADIVYHLAGVNRPQRAEDFETVNTGLTARIVSILEDTGAKPVIVFTSSTQAHEDNPYGQSKKKAEEILTDFSLATGSPVHIYRLANVFGKWCRPHYNSVVATFCHNVSHGLDISISDRSKEMELVYIDDVIASFIQLLDGNRKTGGPLYGEISPAYRITLGVLADTILQLHDTRKTLILPDLSDDFIQRLYATYLSYLEIDDFSYLLDIKMDERGSLAEIIKSEQFGQIFVSTTHSGIVRGNHYHDTKVEKFFVLKGEALVRLRHVLNDTVITYHVSGDKIEVIDIPPGYTHSIENLSDDDMIVLFWASQIFDPENPDTYFSEA